MSVTEAKSALRVYEKWFAIAEQHLPRSRSLFMYVKLIFFLSVIGAQCPPLLLNNRQKEKLDVGISWQNQEQQVICLAIRISSPSHEKKQTASGSNINAIR